MAVDMPGLNRALLYSASYVRAATLRGCQAVWFLPRSPFTSWPMGVARTSKDSVDASTDLTHVR